MVKLLDFIMSDYKVCIPHIYLSSQIQVGMIGYKFKSGHCEVRLFKHSILNTQCTID